MYDSPFDTFTNIFLPSSVLNELIDFTGTVFFTIYTNPLLFPLRDSTSFDNFRVGTPVIGASVVGEQQAEGFQEPVIANFKLTQPVRIPLLVHADNFV